MSEQKPPPLDALDRRTLADRSLREWHQFLTVDAEGEPTGHLFTPGSRYGRNGEACAWWAIAAGTIYTEANGEEDTEALLDNLMGLAVNDSDGIAQLIVDYWYYVPKALQEQLGTKGDVVRLLR